MAVRKAIPVLELSTPPRTSQTVLTDFCSVTPMLSVGQDFTKVIQFFIEKLGFLLDWFEGDMAGLCRGPVRFNIIGGGTGSQCSYSVGVLDVKALSRELVMRGTEIVPSGHEDNFHVVTPGGICLQFHTEEHS